MMRLLGMRLVTRLLLLVCSLSLISLLFLSRCGLSGLDTSAVLEETESQPGVVSAIYMGIILMVVYKMVFTTRLKVGISLLGYASFHKFYTRMIQSHLRHKL